MSDRIEYPDLFRRHEESEFISDKDCVPWYSNCEERFIARHNTRYMRYMVLKALKNIMKKKGGKWVI